ncbi:MAG: hypothetical protein WAO28_01360 [Candidatus Microsaccharimonas sp.]
MVEHVNKTDHHPKSEEVAKFGKLRLAFLYILIGGLAISALISVIAILIGEFNQAVVKALLTTFIFVTHSLLVLAIVSSDKHNQLGKSLIPTTILGAVIANMLTSTLGTWELWLNNLSWKSFLFYMLVIGVVFLITVILKLRLAHKATNTLVYVTVGLLVLMTTILTPWVFAPDAAFIGDFYFRLIGAVTILSATALSIAAIVNRIAVAQNRKLVGSDPKSLPITGGTLAINIVVGIMVAIFWSYGLTVLLTQALTSDNPRHSCTTTSDYSSYGRYRYDPDC